MKRKIARQWSAALDSGEYKQCTGRLRKGDKFCVMGVLCNLHAQAHPEIAAKQKVKSKYLGQDELPADEVIAWAGMCNDSGNISGELELVELNDSKKLTFPEIAKVIRKYWKEL